MSLFISKSISKTAFGYVASVLLLAGTATIQADPTTENFTNTSSIVSSTFTLPDFDTTLGTLQAVTLTLDLTDSATIQVYDLASGPEDFQNASLTQQNTLTAPGLVLAPSVNAIVAGGTANSGLNNVVSIPASQTATGNVDPRIFTLWEDQAGGTVDLSFTKGNPTFEGTDLGPNNLFFGGNLTGTATATVEYTYLASGTLAAPEPAGRFLTLLAGMAMTALAFGRLRLFQV